MMDWENAGWWWKRLNSTVLPLCSSSPKSMSFEACSRLAPYAHVVWYQVVVLCQSAQSRYRALEAAFRVSIPIVAPLVLSLLISCFQPKMLGSTTHGRVLGRLGLNAISLANPQNVVASYQDLAECP